LCKLTTKTNYPLCNTADKNSLNSGSIVKELELEIMTIDGKTMKQFYDRNYQQKALHIVNAWSSSHQLVLGQKSR
jgi:hypothetical protein